MQELIDKIIENIGDENKREEVIYEIEFRKQKERLIEFFNNVTSKDLIARAIIAIFDNIMRNICEGMKEIKTEDVKKGDLIINLIASSFEKTLAEIKETL